MIWAAMCYLHFRMASSVEKRCDDTVSEAARLCVVVFAPTARS
jgi:hypothetical protein